MAIPTRLSRKLRESLGDEGANDIVDWMVQVEDRRSELQGVVEAWKSETAARSAELGARTDLRFAEFSRRMEVGFAEQREATARLEARIEQRFGDLIKWSFVFWCGAIGAMSLLTR